jgi:hypothetical protein
VSVSNVDFLGDLGKLASGGDFSGYGAESLLLLVALEEQHSNKGGKDDREVGQDLA